MFGISFSEMLIIAVVTIIVLGPDKLPKAMYEIAKFIKAFKKTIDDARSGIEQEMKIAELKEDAKKYKEKLAQTNENLRKKLTFEELDEIKKKINESKEEIEQNITSIAKKSDEEPNLAQDNKIKEQKEDSNV